MIQSRGSEGTAGAGDDGAAGSGIRSSCFIRFALKRWLPTITWYAISRRYWIYRGCTTLRSGCAVDRAMRGPAFFAYANNYLIDVKFGIIMDVEASRAIRQAEVGAAATMIERTEECFGIKPERLAADTAYGSAADLNWLVNEKQIAPHIPVIDKSKRDDGTFSRVSEDNGYGQHRPRDPLQSTRAGVSGMPTQAQMLPEYARSQDRARCQRGRPRRGASARQNCGLRAILP
jgi:hypothetical protein